MSTLLQTPERQTPRGPDAVLRIKAIEDLGFERGVQEIKISRLHFERTLTSRRAPVRPRRGDLRRGRPTQGEVPQHVFYKGPNLIVHLEDYFDKEGNVIQAGGAARGPDGDHGAGVEGDSSPVLGQGSAW